MERAEEGEEVEVFVDRTPFYAEAGGQVGDTGMIETETGGLEVADTQGPVPALHGHQGSRCGRDSSRSVRRRSSP